MRTRRVLYTLQYVTRANRAWLFTAPPPPALYTRGGNHCFDAKRPSVRIYVGSANNYHRKPVVKEPRASKNGNSERIYERARAAIRI